MSHRKRRKPTRRRVKENLHAKRRLEERYGLEINKAERQLIIKMIQEQGTKYMVRRRSNRTALFRVPFRGVELFVVYDNKRQSLVTALKPEWIKHNDTGST